MAQLANFLSSRERRVTLGLLPAIGAWTYFRVAENNPVILGDEYIYSLNARHGSFWGPQIAGDFSNYLFNFVFSLTSLCGPGFYTCTKILNIFFFLGMLTVVFLIAERFISGWGLPGIVLLIGISPISVYTSLFIPEMFYFFGLSLVVLLVLRAIEGRGTPILWAFVGVSLGITSLIKPHAWLSLVAIVSIIAIQSLGFSSRRLGRLLQNSFAFLSAAIGSRLVIGFALAGPQAISPFGSYVNSETAAQLTSINAAPSDAGVAGSGPLNGLIALFPVQMEVHLLVLVSLSSLALVLTIMGVINVFLSRELSASDGFALFVFIWTASLVIEVVAFTGWITGGGDDHTTRVLMRYYDIVMIYIPLAALAVLSSKRVNNWNALLRWSLAGVVAILATRAYSGFFADLTIQIADAPSLAGLVVDEFTWAALSTLSIVGLLVFAAFPQFSKIALFVSLVGSLALPGWQIQDQYAGFRSEDSRADSAGKWIASEYVRDDEARVQVFGPSRFEVTNAAFWIDNPQTTYEILSPGSLIESSQVDEESTLIVLLGDISLQNESGFDQLMIGDDFKVLSR